MAQRPVVGSYSSAEVRSRVPGIPPAAEVLLVLVALGVRPARDEDAAVGEERADRVHARGVQQPGRPSRGRSPGRTASCSSTLRSQPLSPPVTRTRPSSSRTATNAGTRGVERAAGVHRPGRRVEDVRRSGRRRGGPPRSLIPLQASWSITNTRPSRSSRAGERPARLGHVARVGPTSPSRCRGCLRTVSGSPTGGLPAGRSPAADGASDGGREVNGIDDSGRPAATMTAGPMRTPRGR